ncbi:hypothetical protein GS597_13470 [Synechococcales cyanobacterium C]|uniref:Uncharacterized protein n=1 Tax=Petrachloros mirabilis ULC683 TaxID=2781853 RepID=A0A8K1ZYH7_9CYAN|nr:hypothetical protein [Petrachloros mirabilis]NCJ07499.1 hypothetical protein [Petrachloros mirabilis ULC683]
MSNQYAFAVAFDAPPESPSLPWPELKAAITAAALPALDSDRWDEFGEGRIFWGTLTECEAVKQVLQAFSLDIQEERNLDPGYYATPDATYYVDETGNIFTGVPANGSGNPGSVISVTAIPLDAFKTELVPPEIAAKLQIAAQGLDPEQITALNAQISSLEQQVQAAEALAASRIDPEGYQQLQQEAIGQAAHIGDLTAQIQSLSAQVQDWQAQAQGKVDADTHATLQHQFVEQEQRIQELEAQIADLEAQLQKWQAIATGKVEPEEYATAQNQLADQGQQIVRLEQEVAALTQEVAALTQQLQEAQTLTLNKVDADSYTSVEQDQSVQAAHIAELEQAFREQALQITALEQELSLAKAEAETLVSRERYEALEQDLEIQKAIVATLEQRNRQAPAAPEAFPRLYEAETTPKKGFFSFLSRFWSS